MTKEEHIKRYEILHRNLDELVGDAIMQTGIRPTEWNIMQLIEWSFRQTDIKTIDHDEMGQ